MKLLLHTCCGPCFLGVWEDLITSGLSVSGLFYNPNIYPEGEYKKRYKNLKRAAKGRVADIIEPEYNPNEHAQAITGIEDDFPKRCLACYELRLTRTAKMAKEQKFDLFSTTLLISPYQQHEKLKKIGEKIADEVGIEFFYRDWRPYFRSGQSIAREMDIYRQKYCGCLFSINN